MSLKEGIEIEIIVVNDCSSDNTIESIVQYIKKYPDFPIQLFNQEVNKGKGAAIHKAISEASDEYLIVQDADLEYDPEEYNKLLKPVLNGFADVVYGSRFIGGDLIEYCSFGIV